MRHNFIILTIFLILLTGLWIKLGQKKYHGAKSTKGTLVIVDTFDHCLELAKERNDIFCEQDF